MEFNNFWQEARSQRHLISLCFVAAPASDWLRHFRPLLCDRRTGFNETWQETRSQRPLTSLCYSDRSKRPPWPLIGWDIFDISSMTAEHNSTKIDRKQDISAKKFLFFFSGRSEKQDGRPGLWLAETFSTSPPWLMNKISTSSTKFVLLDETWQKARYQRPLQNLCYSGRSEKQDSRPGFWLAETFSTSSLKPLNGIQQNLTGNKMSTSFSKFVFVGTIGKSRWPSWPLISWDIFDFTSETVEMNWTKLYQVFFVFWPIGKQTRPPWPILHKGGTLYSGLRCLVLGSLVYVLTDN